MTAKRGMRQEDTLVYVNAVDRGRPTVAYPTRTCLICLIVRAPADMTLKYDVRSLYFENATACTPCRRVMCSAPAHHLSVGPGSRRGCTSRRGTVHCGKTARQATTSLALIWYRNSLGAYGFTRLPPVSACGYMKKLRRGPWE